MDPDHGVTRRWLDTQWRKYTAKHYGGHYPYEHPTEYSPQHEATFYHEKPLLNVGTAAYSDVDTFMSTVWSKHIDKLGYKWAMVVGDQQSYSRMVWSKHHDPQRIIFLIPLPGEFHFVVHLLMAIHILWYEPLSHCIVEVLVDNTEANWHKVIKKDWNNVKEWHHYDQFYTYIICAILLYFSSILGVSEADMANYTLLCDYLQDNEGGCPLSWLLPCHVATALLG